MIPFRMTQQPSSEPLTLAEVRLHLRQYQDGDTPGYTPSAGGDTPSFAEDYPDDSWVRSKISAAREFCEEFLGFPLTDGVYVEGYDGFNSACDRRWRSPASRRTDDAFYGSRGEGYGLSPRGYSGFYGNGPWGVWGSRYLVPSQPRIALQFFVDEIVSVSYVDATNTLQSVSPASYDFDAFNRDLYFNFGNDTPGSTPAGATPAGGLPTLSDRPNPVRVEFRGEYGAADSPSTPVPEIVKAAMLLMIGEWYENRALTIDGRSTQIVQGVEYALQPLRMRLGVA